MKRIAMMLAVLVMGLVPVAQAQQEKVILETVEIPASPAPVPGIAAKDLVGEFSANGIKSSINGGMALHSTIVFETATAGGLLGSMTISGRCRGKRSVEATMEGTTDLNLKISGTNLLGCDGRVATFTIVDRDTLKGKLPTLAGMQEVTFKRSK